MTVLRACPAGAAEEAGAGDCFAGLPASACEAGKGSAATSQAWEATAAAHRPRDHVSSLSACRAPLHIFDEVSLDVYDHLHHDKMKVEMAKFFSRSWTTCISWAAAPIPAAVCPRSTSRVESRPA